MAHSNHIQGQEVLQNYAGQIQQNFPTAYYFLHYAYVSEELKERSGDYITITLLNYTSNAFESWFVREGGKV